MKMASLHHLLNSSIPNLEFNLTLTAADTFYANSSRLMAFLSILGCLVIWLMYFLYKEVRTMSRLLLLFLSLANILACLATFMQIKTYTNSIQYPSQYTVNCQGAAGIWVLSQISVALWTCAITFYLFMCVSLHYVRIANRIVFLFHVFCWFMPVVVAVSADISGVYGYDLTDVIMYSHPTPCWISDRVINPVPWYLITVEGWVMATSVLVSVLYIPITWTIVRKRGKGKEITGDDVVEELAIQTANEQLRYIPVIYVATRIWGTLYFMFTRYPDDRHLRASDWLMIIKGFGDNSQGLFNAIFFCITTKPVRALISTKLRQCCRCFCGWCKKQKQIGKQKWMRVPRIVKSRSMKPRRSRTLDGSDLDISGISLDMPPPGGLEDHDVPLGEEDEVIFER